jgi:hypothetical protein
MCLYKREVNNNLFIYTLERNMKNPGKFEEYIDGDVFIGDIFTNEDISDLRNTTKI